MRRFPRTPTRSFLFAVGIIIAVVAGVGIPLGLTGTQEQPSWMPHGTGIDIPSPSENVFRPEMVIITTNAFKSTLEPLAQWKNQKGTPCIVNSTEEIYAQYPGRDNPEKIRNYLKYLYTNASLKWVLLAGDNDTVPMRYVYNDDVYQLGFLDTKETAGSSRYYKPTDFYYSDLTGTWDTDGDGNFGERATNTPNKKDEVDWTPEVYVGRFPSSDQSTLQTLVAKTLAYEKEPLNDTWMNDFLLGGAIADSSPLNDEGLTVQNIIDNYIPRSMDVTKCTDTDLNLTGGPFPASINTGESLIHFQGHGSQTALANYASQIALNTGDALGLTNTDKPGLMFAAACSTGAYDVYSGDTLMEALLFRPQQGVIGYIGSLRVDWYFDFVKEDQTNNRFNSLNRGMARYFWQNFFTGGLHQPGKALADMKVSYIHSQWFQDPGWGDLDLEYERKNLFTYTLWGDPELSISTAQLGEFADPLPTVVYAGQRLQESIKYNITGYVVPGATVCIQSGDFYYTSHASGGSFDVRLALDPRTYNMTITGPNMKPFNRTFTTVVDTEDPQAPEVEEVPPSPDWVAPRYSVNDAFTFALHATDSKSGVGVVVLHVSYDSFATCANFSLEKDPNTDRYSATLYNFPPGEMRYYFTVMDYAENAIDVMPGFASPLLIDPLISHYGVMAMGILAVILMGLMISVSLMRKWRIWKQLPAYNGQDSSASFRSEKKNERKLDLA